MPELSNGIPEIDMTGFQVVSGDMFENYSRYNNPSCTLWPTSISFNKASITALNSCERVRIEINPTTKCMLVIPVTNKDRDNVRWVAGIKDPKTRKIDCKAFTSKLYNIWDLKENLNYRTSGVIVSSDKKVMLLYDFSKAESWETKPKQVVR